MSTGWIPTESSYAYVGSEAKVKAPSRNATSAVPRSSAHSGYVSKPVSLYNYPSMVIPNETTQNQQPSYNYMAPPVRTSPPRTKPTLVTDVPTPTAKSSTTDSSTILVSPALVTPDAVPPQPAARTVTMDVTHIAPTRTVTVDMGTRDGEPLRFVITAPALDIIQWDELELDHELGSGAFGKVHKGTFRFTEVAVKVFENVASQEQIQRIIEEVSVLSTLRHANCVFCMGVAVGSNNIGVVTEFMGGGDLRATIRIEMEQGRHSILSRADKVAILIDVAKGLHYLHSTSIVAHRDIKPENILLDENKKHAKIADFGLSGKSFAEGGGFTHRYAAPEVLMGGPATPYADVYSLGCVMFEMMTLRRPFEHIVNAENRAKGNAFESPCSPKSVDELEKLPKGLHDLIRRCWDGTQCSRPETKEIITFLMKSMKDDPWTKQTDAPPPAPAPAPVVVPPQPSKMKKKKKLNKVDLRDDLSASSPAVSNDTGSEEEAPDEDAEEERASEGSYDAKPVAKNVKNTKKKSKAAPAPAPAPTASTGGILTSISNFFTRGGTEPASPPAKKGKVAQKSDKRAAPPPSKRAAAPASAPAVYAPASAPPVATKSLAKMAKPAARPSSRVIPRDERPSPRYEKEAVMEDDDVTVPMAELPPTPKGRKERSVDMEARDTKVATEKKEDRARTSPVRKSIQLNK